MSRCRASFARNQKPGPESGPGIRYLILSTPLCPYGIAYYRAYGLLFRWTVPFSRGSGVWAFQVRWLPLFRLACKTSTPHLGFTLYLTGKGFTFETLSWSHFDTHLPSHGFKHSVRNREVSHAKCVPRIRAAAPGKYLTANPDSNDRDDTGHSRIRTRTVVLWS